MLIFGSIFKYYPQFTNLTQVFYENFQNVLLQDYCFAQCHFGQDAERVTNRKHRFP